MTRKMLSYEETMQLGAQNYAEPIEALRQDGWHAEFTQTGGMNAAIQITLEGGSYLLVTDAEDSLSWYREEQEGWGVGYWVDTERHNRPEYDGCLVYECVEETIDTDSLLRLVRIVVREGTNEFLRIRSMLTAETEG